MKVFIVALAALIATAASLNCDPAFARKPKAAKAAQAAPKPVLPPMAEPATTGPLAATYSAMPVAERVSIQSDLIWTGDYNGLMDGTFSDHAIAAVKAFQKRVGGKDSGVLTPEERQRLAAAARPQTDRFGWQLVDDSATGARIGLPTKLVPRPSAGQYGGHWQSVRGEMKVDTFRFTDKDLSNVLDLEKQAPSGRDVDYTVIRPDFFVIGGLQGGVKRFYIRAQIRNGEIRGIAIQYDQAMEGIVERVIPAMSSAFTPFPSTAIAAAASRTH
jgi:hypothetical protein